MTTQVSSPKFLVRVAIAFAMVGAISANLEAQENLAGVKCLVSHKKSASLDHSVEYKGGKVFFCCEHCVEAFNKDVKLKERAKFATKANHQLVLTGQFVQKGCPMSGGAVDPNLMASVGTIKVGFCCEGCRQKVNEAEGVEAKAKLVFAESAFKKAFEKKPIAVKLDGVKCMMMPSKDVVAKQAIDYKGGQVYFCCARCAKKFADAPDEFATQANQQLVATGQFVQIGCPISGGDTDDDQSSVVGGVAVKFCCDKCKGKVDRASTDAAKSELVFSEKRFDKAFEQK
ncbi:MAG: YHS domain-containing protein [Mariniblastus sp.]|jgi:YHS domain-containing protein